MPFAKIGPVTKIGPVNRHDGYRSAEVPQVFLQLGLNGQRITQGRDRVHESHRESVARSLDETALMPLRGVARLSGAGGL
jgi:hypothetical protein